MSIAIGGDRIAAMRNHSMKMMWGCVALVALVAVFAVAGSNAGYLAFALPCMLMMGMMMWMMLGDGGRHGGDQNDQK